MLLNHTKLKPGDILLYKPHFGSKATSWFIVFAQRLVGQSPAKKDYCHIALVDEDTNYLLEAKWPRTHRKRIDFAELALDYDVELWRVKKITPDQIKQATEWARQHLGLFYDLGLFFFGLFDFKKAEVCSTYVQKAFQAANIELSIEGPGKKLTTPSEIAANTKMIRKVAP